MFLGHKTRSSESRNGGGVGVEPVIQTCQSSRYLLMAELWLGGSERLHFGNLLCVVLKDTLRGGRKRTSGWECSLRESTIRTIKSY